MRSRSYYTLIASLPPLPRFDRAERLPITRERLLERRRMLDPEDADLLDRLEAFLSWHRQPAARTDEEMVRSYDGMRGRIDHPVLKDLCGVLVNQRTIMAGLRRRHLGLPPPAPGEPWGMGPLKRHMEQNWDDPHFKLQSAYPWIAEAREHLTAGKTLALDHLLLNRVWDQADRLVLGKHFEFEVVLAYLIKWDAIRQWLSYDAEAAAEFFEQRVLEVMHGNE
ncbi:MAG: hypothetical protein JRK53_02710 [Deltaproteobacteria bacterium]|nr:hypothetical protein [Deltaproteobacteria bacterium]MBW1819344.1 hypothetical protein [Deltaproteobacteria bacterium]MBW2283779.1 hypothetical protein [Deltaproteobacteria bacterium]